MWQPFCFESYFKATPNNSHRRKTFSMFSLWQEIYAVRYTNKTQENTLCKKDPSMFRVWEELPRKERFKTSQAFAQWRKTPCMQFMWPGIFTVSQPEGSHEEPCWKGFIYLQTMSKIFLWTSKSPNTWKALIFTLKWLNRAKTGMLHGTPKFFPGLGQGVSRVHKTQVARINWKIKSILSGLVTRRLYFLKKYDTKWAFFPPCRNWPICICSFCNSEGAGVGEVIGARGRNCFKSN